MKPRMDEVSGMVVSGSFLEMSPCAREVPVTALESDSDRSPSLSCCSDLGVTGAPTTPLSVSFHLGTREIPLI